MTFSHFDLQKFISFLTFLMCFYSSLSYCHEGRHATVLPQQEIVEKSHQIIQEAIEKKALEPSWKEAKFVEAKLGKQQDEWVVKYLNANASKEKELFIFIGLDGKYIAMNYSGK